MSKVFKTYAVAPFTYHRLQLRRHQRRRRRARPQNRQRHRAAPQVGLLRDAWR